MMSRRGRYTANFVVLAEVIPLPFIISAEIAASPLTIPRRKTKPPPYLNEAKEKSEKRNDDFFQLWRPLWYPYDRALEVWYRSELVVTLNSQLTASACDDTGDYTSETAHNVRKALARATVGRMNFEKELLYE